jgi:hypothetical protein
MQLQTNPNGILFRQRFAAYMAMKYPISGRARVPDRFQHRWSAIQKKIYKIWLRRGTIPDMAAKMKLPEAEITDLLEDILAQLEEAGLLSTLEQGVRLEAFQQRERRTYEDGFGSPGLTDAGEQTEMADLLESISQPESLLIC